MNNIEKFDPRDYERVLLQSALIKELKKIHDDEKAAITHPMSPGDRKAVMNARGVLIGSISKAAPKINLVIDDMQAVLGAVGDQYGWELELPEVGTNEALEAVQVLQEHAPHLLTPVFEKDELKKLTDKVRGDYEETGNLPVGWKIVEGRAPYPSLRLNDTGKRVLAHMLENVNNALELPAGETNE